MQVSKENDTVPKLDLASPDLAAERRKQLLSLFPECHTEGGKIDFDKLQRTLGDTIDVGKERYGMNWPGKADCFKAIQTPSLGTLRPLREESVNFDTAENLIIEGDNLEVLKLLQKSYAGKVKMIYIDPPYNTGKDFIYPDDYTESLQTYLEYTGQVDAHGKKWSTNTESDGRFHSKWMNMMYPRLYIARNLLKADGLVFVSIDDHEYHNLHRIMNEVFGEENFCATFIWNSEGNTDNQYSIKVTHEYIIAFYKDVNFADSAIGSVIDPNTRDDSNLWKGIADNNVNKNNPENPPEVITLPAGFPCTEKELFYAKKKLDDDFFVRTKNEKYISDSVKEDYGIEKLSGLPVKLDDLVVKDYKLAKDCRVYGGMANKNKLLAFIRNGCEPIEDEGAPLRFYLNANAAVRYNRENQAPSNILSVLRNFGTTEKTKTYLKQMGITYDYPKPVSLLEYLIRIGCSERHQIVLDFFAGSGTTAEAILNVNKEDRGDRKFILIQLPEETHTNHLTISNICKARVRYTIDSLRKADAGLLPLAGDALPESGFRVFKLAESNFETWNENIAQGDREALTQQLKLYVDHVRKDRNGEDLLYEIMLKSGFSLTTPIELLQLADKTVYSVAEGALLICIEKSLSIECIQAMADRQPQRIVCLDVGFAGQDELKANAAHTFKAKGVAEFRTV